MEEGDLSRSCHTAQVFENKMYVFGGLNAENKATNELWSLDLNDFKWTKCLQKGDVPSAHCENASALIGNKMCIFGNGSFSGSVEEGSRLFALDIGNMF